jgi:hypothetical protein
MPFPTYKGIGEVLKEYQIVSIETDFITEVPLTRNESCDLLTQHIVSKSL